MEGTCLVVPGLVEAERTVVVELDLVLRTLVVDLELPSLEAASWVDQELPSLVATASWVNLERPSLVAATLACLDRIALEHPSSLEVVALAYLDHTDLVVPLLVVATSYLELLVQAAVESKHFDHRNFMDPSLFNV